MGSVNKVREAGYVTRSDGKKVWRGELWRARVTIDGKERAVYGPKEADVVAKLNDLKGAAAQGGLVDPTRTTVAAHLEEWLRHLAAVGRRPVTVATYRDQIRWYLLPTLGKVPLQKLRADHVQRCYTGLRERGLSPTTVGHAHKVLHGALKHALRLKLVGRNVAADVEPPVPARSPVRVLTGEEVARFLEVAGGHDLAALWTLLAHTGARQGELLALKWSDLVWDAGDGTGRLTIQRNLVRRFRTLEDPKTARARRTLRLHAEVLDALRLHRDRQEFVRRKLVEGYADQGLIFADTTGGPLVARTVVRQFKRLLRRAGLPETFKFHGGRHTAATLMLTNGVDVPTVAAILGHAQSSTTLNIYGHVLPTGAADAADKLARAIRPRPAAAESAG